MVVPKAVAIGEGTHAAQGGPYLVLAVRRSGKSLPVRFAKQVHRARGTSPPLARGWYDLRGWIVRQEDRSQPEPRHHTQDAREWALSRSARPSYIGIQSQDALEALGLVSQSARDVERQTKSSN